ncbi:MAG TPA: hypothetical protein VKA60_08965 [Blastocatellia bacterium]|nr:hypothetical protein [Blastocatellia bacterium]
MKRTLTILTASLLLIGTFLLGGSSHAQGDAERPSLKAKKTRCTAESVAGTYAYHGSGTITQSPAPQIPAGPFTTVGMLTLNADGTFAYKGTRSFNGFIDTAAQGIGTFTVNNDCTATGIDNIGTPYNIVFADGGNEVYIMFSAPGLVITTVGKRL